MSKKQGVLPLIFLVIALGSLAWWNQSWRQPVYQGKPLGAWLKDLENWNGDTNNPAFVAFHEMGAKAIPSLVGVIESGGPPVERLILKINQHESIVQLPFGTPWRQETAAACGLYAMGTNATPALPAMTNLLFHSNALFTATFVMAGIGPKALPSLLMALTNQNDRIRESAVASLGWERYDFDTVVPALIASLHDSDRIGQWMAVHSLGQLHAKPELSVPVLMNAFTNEDALTRSGALTSLGLFGGNARESIPMVVAALKDKDESVRKMARFALKRIDPATAIKEGVK